MRPPVTRPVPSGRLVGGVGGALASDGPGRTPSVHRLPAPRPGLSLLTCVPGFLCEDVTRQRARHASCAPAEHGLPSPPLPSGLEKVTLAGPSLVVAAWVTVFYGPGSRGLRMTHQDTDPLCLSAQGLLHWS